MTFDLYLSPDQEEVFNWIGEKARLGYSEMAQHAIMLLHEDRNRPEYLLIGGQEGRTEKFSLGFSKVSWGILKAINETTLQEGFKVSITRIIITAITHYKDKIILDRSGWLVLDRTAREIASEHAKHVLGRKLNEWICCTYDVSMPVVYQQFKKIDDGLHPLATTLPHELALVMKQLVYP